MQEIRCPKCGEVFRVDETGYDQIAQQVRDKEFERELERRKKELEAKHERELEVIRLQEEKEHTASMTQKDAEISAKERKIVELQAKLDASETAKKLAVAEAIEKKNEELSQKTTEIADLRGELKNRETESRLSEKSLQEQYEEKLKLKDEQIEYYKDFKARQSTTKHKNEDFFKELDKDRKEKNCEYAILVSLLEIDNELYNNGIVDVSYKYPKMYVIRPQFFIPMITLLRNAAKNSLQYRQELQIVRNQQVDIRYRCCTMVTAPERMT